LIDYFVFYVWFLLGFWAFCVKNVIFYARVTGHCCASFMMMISVVQNYLNLLNELLVYAIPCVTILCTVLPEIHFKQVLRSNFCFFILPAVRGLTHKTIIKGIALKYCFSLVKMALLFEIWLSTGLQNVKQKLLLILPAY
jgi:hypothetical protein